MSNKNVNTAIILAAGFGMRMVPINTQIPKGLLEINGERLIERIIRQLHEVEIHEIYVIVGFMKESYYYLKAKYGVHIIVNNEFQEKNNLYSLSLACSHIANSYIIPCDIWCRENPFKKDETSSWYMVSDLVDDNSSVRLNHKNELICIPKYKAGNAMIGIAYINDSDGKFIKDIINVFISNEKHKGDFWESTLCHNKKFLIPARVVSMQDVVEINTYEQLRELDGLSSQLKTDAIDVVSQVLNTEPEKIVDIQVLKKGMTNRSFLFRVENEKYIMRIPGEGTDKLINRKQEADVYNILAQKRVCDDIIYINPENGYKISRYINGARVCDYKNWHDVKQCMELLRCFHSKKLIVRHEFDVFEKIDFYESLWEEKKSVYKDYQKVKISVMALKKFIDKQHVEKCLTHIDAVPDNFLFRKVKNKEEIRLIDWEYAGMQDPHLDIAMFAIYAGYNKHQIDKLINLYFLEGCSEIVRLKIYCYIAVAGLLWSNWCEYKRCLGVEFGEYAKKQYQYAKRYSELAQQMINSL